MRSAGCEVRVPGLAGRSERAEPATRRPLAAANLRCEDSGCPPSLVSGQRWPADGQDADDGNNGRDLNSDRRDSGSEPPGVHGPRIDLRAGPSRRPLPDAAYLPELRSELRVGQDPAGRRRPQRHAIAVRRGQNHAVGRRAPSGDDPAGHAGNLRPLAFVPGRHQPPPDTPVVNDGPRPGENHVVAPQHDRAEPGHSGNQRREAARASRCPRPARRSRAGEQHADGDQQVPQLSRSSAELGRHPIRATASRHVGGLSRLFARTHKSDVNPSDISICAAPSCPRLKASAGP
jgi:hypothetical protein